MSYPEPAFAPTGIELVDDLIDTTKPKQHEGRLTWTLFYPADRYLFDFNLALGDADDPGTWSQFDTTSDAAYFGLWLHKHERLILEYAEGDLSLSHYATAEAYDQVLVRLCQRHEPAPSCSTINVESGLVTRYFEDRRPFFHDPAQFDAIASQLADSES